MTTQKTAKALSYTAENIFNKQKFAHEKMVYDVIETLLPEELKDFHKCYDKLMEKICNAADGGLSFYETYSHSGDFGDDNNWKNLIVDLLKSKGFKVGVQYSSDYCNCNVKISWS